VVAAAEATGLQLAVKVDPEIGAFVGDPNRLQQIVWNLVSNAVKFTQHGTITVRLERREVDRDVRIVVADTGQGISAGFLPHVFDHSARSRQARRDRMVDSVLDSQLRGNLSSFTAAGLPLVTISGHNLVVKKVRIADLKARLSEYLRAVRGGETIAVLDRDTPVAHLVPIRGQSALRVRKPAPGTPAPNRVRLPKPTNSRRCGGMRLVA
jgi:prevent-host-death family protein